MLFTSHYENMYNGILPRTSQNLFVYPCIRAARKVKGEPIPRTE